MIRKELSGFADVDPNQMAAPGGWVCSTIQTGSRAEMETESSSAFTRMKARTALGEEAMQVKVEQLDKVQFAIHARQHRVFCDQAVENGGNDEGMTPPELMLAALGSCAAFYAVQYLKTRSLATGGVEVTVDAEKLMHPARLGNFRIEVDCPVTLTGEQQSGMVRSVHSCLIHNTLMSVPEIAIELKVPVAG